MKLLRSAAACALAILLLFPAARVVAQPYPPDGDPAAYAPDAAPDPGDYDASLAPYGRWADDPGYGRVWAPSVSPGWAPYVDGSWAWTPDGWTWVSSEPWAWTFHYGRWTLLPTGWVWVPGTEWGPAWVDWYWGDGYVGWAPLAPRGPRVAVIDRFVFVPTTEFCSRRLHFFERGWRNVPDRVIHDWHRRDFRPPPRDRIERVARQPVPHFDRRPPGTIAPSRLARRPRPYRRVERALDRPVDRGAPFARPEHRPPRHVRERAGFVATPPPVPARQSRLGRPRPVVESPGFQTPAPARRVRRVAPPAVRAPGWAMRRAAAPAVPRPGAPRDGAGRHGGGNRVQAPAGRPHHPGRAGR